MTNSLAAIKEAGLRLIGGIDEVTRRAEAGQDANTALVLNGQGGWHIVEFLKMAALGAVVKGLGPTHPDVLVVQRALGHYGFVVGGTAQAGSTEPSYLWVKIHETFGFVGVSAGGAAADVDRHLAQAQVTELLGADIEGIASAGAGFELPDEVVSRLAAQGWALCEAYDACNGDVYAHAFMRLAGC